MRFVQSMAGCLHIRATDTSIIHSLLSDRSLDRVADEHDVLSVIPTVAVGMLGFATMCR